MTIIDYLLRGSNHPVGSAIKFKSSDHIRFQFGEDVSGHNYGCHRTVRIESNISGGEGYSVTILNDDTIHPLWGNNVQMAPKQMRVVDCNQSMVELRGFGSDCMGNSYADYGISIYFEGNEISSCILHMIDRGVDLQYFK